MRIRMMLMNAPIRIRIGIRIRMGGDVLYSVIITRTPASSSLLPLYSPSSSLVSCLGGGGCFVLCHHGWLCGLRIRMMLMIAPIRFRIGIRFRMGRYSFSSVFLLFLIDPYVFLHR